ncbi:MAG: class I SAM-dependent methyltransferase [Candidatus Omnitrophica bacterium]|nr:class I SAM-dependent methyltransferase [Candidatus Omnitrophota bacterium]
MWTHPGTHRCQILLAVSGKRVLEIGFGEGYGADYLAKSAHEVVGVDMAAGNITRAQAKYPRPNLQFVYTDGTRLDFPDESFDVVGAFQVIEHVPEPNLIFFLKEIFRVLAPSGLVCLSTLNLSHNQKPGKVCLSTLNLSHNQKPGKLYQKLCYHEKEFTAIELKQLLSKVFASVEIHGLYLTQRHHIYQRLKKWGLNRIGPTRLNPISKFYEHVTVDDFVARPFANDSALDLLALCRKS